MDLLQLLNAPVLLGAVELMLLMAAVLLANVVSLIACAHCL